MLTRLPLSFAAIVAIVATPALAQTADPAENAASTALAAPQPAAEDAPWPEAWFEIFRLAPGAHEEFVRRIARADEVSKAGGEPPIQLFFHQEGADWDVLLFKPVTGSTPTPAQQAAMEAKRRELKMPSGPAYFAYIRELVAEHTDTKTYGPVSAAQWIAKLEGWRAKNGITQADQVR